MTLPTYGQPIVRSDPQTFPDNIKLFFGDDQDASVYYDGSNLIINPKEVGAGILRVEGDIGIGDGDIAASGVIRLPNASSIRFRNAANSGDVEALQVDGSNNVIVGNIANGDTLYRTESGFVHSFDRTVSIAAGSLDLNSQGSIINIGVAGNQWQANFQIQDVSNDGGDVTKRLANLSNTAGSTATNIIQVAGSSSGDPIVRFIELGSHTIQFGVDVSNSRFAMAVSTLLGTNDVLRITDASPPVVTYNTSHPTGFFDFACDSCGRHEAEWFRCCGSVVERDDVIDFRNLVLNDPKAIDYMAAIGVLEKTFDNDGNPEIFTVLGQDWLFAGAMAWQNRVRIDKQYDEIDRRLRAIGG